MDEILTVTKKFVQLVRSHGNVSRLSPSQNNSVYELEARVGKFNSNGTFTAGITNQYRAVVSKLLSRFEQNCKDDPQHWQKVPQDLIVKTDYPGCLRHIATPQTGASSLLIKKRIDQLDTVTDRHCDLRFSLSEEVTIENNIEKEACLQRMSVEKSECVRIVQRASFIETVDVDIVGYFKFRYDISKISEKVDCETKDQTSIPSTYHFEVELLSDNLDISVDKEIQNRHDEYLATCLLHRARALLGTSLQTATGIVILPQPSLYIFKYPKTLKN